MMKKIIIILSLLVLYLGNVMMYAQEIYYLGRPFYVYTKDGERKVFFCDWIENIQYSHVDLDGNEHSEFVTQEIQTYDKLERIPLASIDSICFVPSEGSVNNLPLGIKQYCALSNNGAHSDFGWPASMIYLDSRTADMPSNTGGYNWFRGGQDYTEKKSDSTSTNYMWFTNYNLINSCNSVLKSIDPTTNNQCLQLCMAQALGYRAWAYFNLAQMYQFTYVGNQNKPCVPILTEENCDQAATDGVPRATVQEVYNHILSDINRSIELLKSIGYIKPAYGFDKQFITASTATGIRARVNLVINNWNEAAADAKYVIDNSDCVPYSIDEVSRPSFWDASDKSWLFAIHVESGEVGNLHCWPGHFVTFYMGGYAQVGVFRKINKTLFESIPTTDVRKGWWCDATGESPNLDAAHSDLLYGYFNAQQEAAYINVKFDTYQSQFYGLCYLNDIPLMRIEEMYYILAEATAMSGEDGASVLNDFVRTYRNPSYCFSGSGKEVQEECWQQRRIEFWGEGLSYFDLQRLKKPVDRVGGGFEPSVCFNIPADDPIRIYMIPESALQSNPAIGENNEEGEIPNPIPE